MPPAVALAVAAGGCAADVSVSPPVVAASERGGCQRLHQALPDTVAGQPRRPTAPSSVLTAAWGDPPIVLRCGGAAPATGGTSLRVNGVTWLVVQPTAPASHSSAARWWTLDRGPAVSLTVPSTYTQADAVVDVSAAVRAALPKSTPTPSAQRSPLPRASAESSSRSTSAG
jgi:hypothetical protein